MPTLTRTVGERILLQTNEGMITVEVASIRGNRVQLNIVAPKSINIYRDHTKKEVTE